METTPESPRNLLIVEDHSNLRESLAFWLTDLFPDVVIHQAANGEEGIATASKIRPYVILIDIGLPGISGLEATKEILRRGIQSQVVILTIHEGQAYQNGARDAGAIYFITKREMYARLPEVIRAVLEKRNEEHGQ